MKKLINNALILLLLTAFVSCHSGLSITKRRYTKGYYVHHSKSPDHKTKMTEHTRLKTAVTDQNNVKSLASEHSTATTAKEKGSQLFADASQAAGANKEQASSRTSGTMMPVEIITNPVKTFRDLSEKITADPAKREALSLLWILVLVLLAVYIAGLLLESFGLGWVIHLLLVAALVLFILWLLRIV